MATVHARALLSSAIVRGQAVGALDAPGPIEIGGIAMRSMRAGSITCGVVAIALAVGAVWPMGAHGALEGLEGGHPELYENGVLAGGREQPTAIAGFGEFHFESAQIGSEGIECVAVGFGAGWNDGMPARAKGQILSWGAAGHVPNGTHTKVSATCRPESPRAFLTDETSMGLEENGNHEVEPGLRKLSVPWNVEALCGVREEEYRPILKVGVPNSEFPVRGSAECPPEPSTQAEEEEEQAYGREQQEKKSCFVSIPAPEGCVHVTVVEPGSGLEVGFGGTIYQGKGGGTENGVKNGLNPTTLRYGGAGFSSLQCEYPTGGGCSAAGTLAGEFKILGYNGLQLLQLK